MKIMSWNGKSCHLPWKLGGGKKSRKIDCWKIGRLLHIDDDMPLDPLSAKMLETSRHPLNRVGRRGET